MKPRPVVRKPDLVAVKQGKTYVIDVKIVSDKRDLNLAHLEKLNKYRSVQIAVEKFGAETELLSVRLNWRGVWSPKSARLLTDANLLSRNDLSVLSTRAVVGGLASFNYFMVYHYHSPRAPPGFPARRVAALTRCDAWYFPAILD